MILKSPKTMVTMSLLIEQKLYLAQNNCRILFSHALLFLAFTKGGKKACSWPSTPFFLIKSFL